MTSFRQRVSRWGLTGLACMLLSASAMAAVTVPSIIGNHMVLQQGENIAIWGKASPGEAVTVTFEKQAAKATADAQGAWKAVFPKIKAGGPFDLTIAGKDSTLTLTDILVGEVWVCSGQSNMEWVVKNTNNAEQEIAGANYPGIHLFTVKKKVAGEPLDNCEGEWKVCTPQSVPEFSAVGYYFGREIHKSLNQPVGLINSSWGGTPAESWTTRPTLESDPALAYLVKDWDKLIADYPKAREEYEKEFKAWEQEAAKAKAEGKPEPKKPGEPRGPEHPWRPAGLFNGMIAPLTPYAIQGAIWYQGESNAGRAYEYRSLFPTMIKDWRKAWNHGPLPFYFVQLANFTDPKPEPGDSDWAELREAQTMTLSLPDTGMAVTIDIGEAKSIHPRNKQDVGKRLALAALAKTYHKSIPYSGPIFKTMEIKEGKAVLSFDYAKGGLKVKGDSLKGFAIAGADKKFVWAKAEVKGKKVIVSSDQVANPVAVRYAWAQNPECNLYNGAGLPASPFRTDDWPGVTVPKK